MDPTMAALDAEAADLLVDSRQQPPELLNLRLLKARTNLTRFRQALPASVEEDPHFLHIEDQLLSTEFELASQRAPKGTSEPSSPEPAPVPAKSVFEELFSLQEDGLRHRKPAVDKIEVNQYQQDQLSSDLVEMAAAIKRNAQIFQEKLDKDGDLVSATGDAMHKTSGNMSSIGSRLAQYRRESQLGWMFYIWSALFIMLSLVLGMLLIQVFGKW